MLLRAFKVVCGAMDVHLVDGTYELFRHFFALPSRQTADGKEVGAIRGVLTNLVLLLESGATHVAVATDHVVESFRNEMWAGYKDGSEMEPAIAEQFGPLEEALVAMGICVWPMVEFEADDGLAAGAAMAAADKRVSRVLICTPDKDLAQCVDGVGAAADDAGAQAGGAGAPTGAAAGKIFQWDRRKDVLFDVAAVKEKFGVLPQSIPDYLALVGDQADGFPGLSRWGPKSAAAVLSHYVKLDAVPDDAVDWEMEVRGRDNLAATLAENRELALLFRQIATVRIDAPVSKSVDELRWQGPEPDFVGVCERIRANSLIERVEALAQER